MGDVFSEYVEGLLVAAQTGGSVLEVLDCVGADKCVVLFAAVVVDLILLRK